MHLLARQPIDLDRPHPFTAAGNTEFNCLLWMPPNEQRAGDIVLVDSTNFTTLVRWHGQPRELLAEFRADAMSVNRWETESVHKLRLGEQVNQQPDESHVRETSMLMELLSKAATVAMLSFVVSSMLAMGAGLTVPQIAEPLRNARLVVLALLANFVVMPLGALALAKVLWLDEPLGIGLLLLGCAAGAPFLPKLAELAKGNLAFAVGAMVLLMVVTVGYLPIVLPLLLPGVTVDPWQIARSLLLLMLLPLVIGLALKACYGDLAARVKPVLDWISNVSLILLVCLITAANIDKVLQVFGTRGILAGLLFIALGLGTGWLLGGPDTDTKRVMALGTGQRNIAAALVVASQSFSDPKVVVMVIVVAIVGLIVLMPLSRALANLKTELSDRSHAIKAGPWPHERFAQDVTRSMR